MTGTAGTAILVVDLVPAIRKQQISPESEDICYF